MTQNKEEEKWAVTFSKSPRPDGSVGAAVRGQCPNPPRQAVPQTKYHLLNSEVIMSFS